MKLAAEAVRETIQERKRRSRLESAALAAIRGLADLLGRDPDVMTLVRELEAVEVRLGQAAQDVRDEIVGDTLGVYQPPPF